MASKNQGPRAPKGPQGRRGRGRGQGQKPWSSDDGRQWRSRDGRKAGLAGKAGPQASKAPRDARRRGGSPKGAPKVRPQAQRRQSNVEGRVLVEGRRAVDEALAAGVPVRRAHIALNKGSQDPKLARLAAAFEADGVEVDICSKAKLDAMSSHGAHQGVVVELADFPYADLEDVVAAAGTGDALVVVLDHVTDEGNFGAIVRSAEVAGASGVVIPKARAASVGVGAYKTSAGAVLHVPIAQVSNLATAVDRLKEAGFWAGAAIEHADTDVWEAPLAGRFCLVMGNEASGVSRLLLDRCDFSCRLPQRGQVESLNVAQAATVMAYEWMRRLWEAGREGGADRG